MTMKKYFETKDLEIVADAIRAGKQVEIDARRLVELEGEYLSCCGRQFSTMPGRVFRVEIPRPEPGEGWRILEPEELARDRDKFYLPHTGGWCSLPPTPDGSQGHDCWYRRRVEAKMRRVELKRDLVGMLRYDSPHTDGCFAHVIAVSEKGFAGYEYADLPEGRSLWPVSGNGDEGFIFPVAFWVEEPE